MTLRTGFVALMLVLAAVAVASAKGGRDGDAAAEGLRHERHGHDANETDDDNGTDRDGGRAHGVNGTYGYRHAFGESDNETKNATKAEWKAQEKGKPSWLDALLAKVRGKSADAGDNGTHGSSEGKRHGGFAEAMKHAPEKVVAKMRQILAGFWGASKAD